MFKKFEKLCKDVGKKVETTANEIDLNSVVRDVESHTKTAANEVAKVFSKEHVEDVGKFIQQAAIEVGKCAQVVGEQAHNIVHATPGAFQNLGNAVAKNDVARNVVDFVKAGPEKHKKVINKLIVDIRHVKIVWKPDDEDDDDDDESHENNEEKKEELQNLQFYHTGTSINVPMYQIKFDTAGYILIINQEIFESDTDNSHNRYGTNLDRDALRNTFAIFGYIPIIKNNLTAREIIKTIHETVILSRTKDSLIVSILSHGDNGVIYGTDLETVDISDIVRIMGSKVLLHKPKMLIIQACRGKKMQRLQDDVIIEEAEDVLAVDEGFQDIKPIKDHEIFLCDFLRIYSVVEGTMSIRHKKHGSWFIQTFCEAIIHNPSDSMQNILIRVQAKVRQMKGKKNERNVPEHSNSLTRNIYLPQPK